MMTMNDQQRIVKCTKQHLVSLDDIIGYEEEKQRMIQIADAFLHYDHYLSQGVPLPKGVLLSGDPGTGKTLFAKALASLCAARIFTFDNYSLYSLKKLFKKAKRHAPSIIFIDELDYYFDEDEDEANVADLLTLLDGMDSYDGVMIIGATSHVEDIPSSLLRSGRMDIHICFGYPDKKEREDMLRYYLDKQLQDISEVDARLISLKTNGFTGADIKNLVSLACREALFHHRDLLLNEDFYSPIHEITLGDIARKNEAKDLPLIATHEAGHLLVGKVLFGASYDISLDRRGDSLGATFSGDNIDPYFVSPYFKDDPSPITLKRVASYLGGIAAEEVVYGHYGEGGYSDIASSCSIIEAALFAGVYGFDYLRFSYETDMDETLSPTRKEQIHEKEQLLLEQAYAVAKQIIIDHRPLLDALVASLLDKSMLCGDESDAIFASFQTH